MTRSMLAAAVAIMGLTAASASNVENGDLLLARATAAPNLHSFAVPIHFVAHLRKPVRLRTRVDGTAYFRAPAQAVLAITNATGIAGAFFKGVYRLDVVPQAWPIIYHVVTVSPAVARGDPVLLLRAEPRAPSGDLEHVIITLTAHALQPVAVEWQYRDGSSVRIAYVNERVGAYALPRRATIALDLPRYRLDADATYGAYELNAAVPESVFDTAK